MRRARLHVGSKIRNVLVGVGLVRDWGSLVVVVVPLVLVRERFMRIMPENGDPDNSSDE